MNIRRENDCPVPLGEHEILDFIRLLHKDRPEDWGETWKMSIESGDTLVKPGIVENTYDVYRITQTYIVRE